MKRGGFMKKIVIIMSLLGSFVWADVAMKSIIKEESVISLPIEKPIRPIRPVNPIVRPVIVHQDNYYNTNYNDCSSYIELLAQKDEEILALKEEVSLLRSKEQVHLQKSLKATHDAELKKFETRQNSVKTHNSISISKEPIE
jgi:hypothetical protein